MTSTDFTPFSALAGGLLIGLSAVFLMATLGRIAGISGIASGALAGTDGDRRWRIAFIAGLLLPGGVLAILNATPEISFVASPLTLVLAGLIVGFGTGLGSGCTSGHGVCGIARLSPRSIGATLTFMLFGFLTVGLLNAII